MNEDFNEAEYLAQTEGQAAFEMGCEAAIRNILSYFPEDDEDWAGA